MRKGMAEWKVYEGPEPEPELGFLSEWDKYKGPPSEWKEYQEWLKNLPAWRVWLNDRGDANTTRVTITGLSVVRLWSYGYTINQ